MIQCHRSTTRTRFTGVQSSWETQIRNKRSYLTPHQTGSPLKAVPASLAKVTTMTTTPQTPTVPSQLPQLIDTMAIHISKELKHKTRYASPHSQTVSIHSLSSWSQISLASHRKLMESLGWHSVKRVKLLKTLNLDLFSSKVFMKKDTSHRNHFPLISQQLRVTHLLISVLQRIITWKSAQKKSLISIRPSFGKLIHKEWGSLIRMETWRNTNLIPSRPSSHHLLSLRWSQPG